VGARTT
jgi:heme-degrading monooxygenase HmoA